MRLAILSDIHGNLAALEAVKADLEAYAPDEVVNLGDCVSGYLWPEETAQFLIAERWRTIAGNHDRYLSDRCAHKMGPTDLNAWGELTPQSKDWLQQLPQSMELDGGVLLCHGTPTSDNDYLLDTKENGICCIATPEEVEARLGDVRLPLVLCGHSHIPRVVMVRGGQFVLNPGSVGLQAFSGKSATSAKVENGSPHARYAIATRVGTRWTFEHRIVEYDWDLAAKQAMRNQQGDWAGALRSGFFTPLEIPPQARKDFIEAPYEDF
ncbi:metallophosphoesterase [Rhodobacteraceae bacterium RKSG542]|uniref:metallophosphoesterase family protein n=1 Tax=Pseudovibrio flavus TaxID=2529854 RepID=UPI0012BD7D7D|nr:metallophosphoesterase family protein [Pseudovibrio flavus]MTI16552.1 metallophosphoesterase [Pseudovibrio flavus]